MNKIIGTLVNMVFLLTVMAATSAYAATVSTFIDEPNECPDKFKDCRIIFGEGEDDYSPVIIKFNGSLEVDEINKDEEGDGGLFPSVDGDEWELTSISSGFGTGDWEYTRGENDPGIRYWVAKASTGYNLFWNVENPYEDDCIGHDVANNNFSCLSLATLVTEGSWITPLNSQGNPRGLSNLTFFDTGTVIPVPAAVWLFGTALIGFIGISRRTKV